MGQLGICKITLHSSIVQLCIQDHTKLCKLKLMYPIFKVKLQCPTLNHVFIYTVLNLTSPYTTTVPNNATCMSSTLATLSYNSNNAYL